MVVRCKAARDTEAWYNDNKDQIFASFGTLYSAQMSVDGIDPRTGEAYPDMCLVSNGASYTQTGEYVISFVYETLTAVWTKEQDDEVTSTDNGLRVLERSEVAAIDTAAPYDEDDVGVATITDGGKTLYLASFQDQTGAESNAQVGRVVTRWMEAGILSRTEDFVGSQDSLVIEAIGPDPSTPSGFSLASKQESNYEGLQTNRFTFLKNDVQLSQSEDKVGSQLAISQQWFNPDADKTLAGYSLASKNTSDFEGIKTVEFRFLKDDVLLSQSEDEIGSQNAITEQWFKPEASRKTKAGYSVARNEVSDVDGIPTELYTFLKDNVELSRSEDLVGSQKAIVTEIFNPTSDPTEAGYSVARTEVSDVEGIPTKRYTFLKNDVQLSASEDEIGSQNAITEQWFKPLESSDDPVVVGRDQKTGYSLARTEVSDVDGIPTERYTFLKDDVELSRSSDLVGSQKAIVTEVFKPSADPTETGYSVARTEVSDVDGIPTKRFTFLKDDVELSRSEDKVGSQLAITTEVFKPSADPTEIGYSVARTEVSDVEGIPTKRFTFLKDNVILSESEDKVGSQLAIVKEVFNGTPDTPSGYSIASEQESNVDGIPTKRFTFLKDGVELSRSEDKVGSQLSITTQVFNPTSDPTESGYSVARTEVSDVEGIPTKRFTFLKDNVVLSVSEDKVGSQKAVVNEVFNPTSEAITGIDTSGTALTGYSESNRTESDYEGIKTIRVQFLKPSILSFQQDFNNGLKRVSVQAFNLDSEAVSAALDEVTDDHKLIATNESDYEGIKTTTFQYQIDESFTEDYELNGLKRISLIELSATNFTAQVIGGLAGVTATPPADDPPNVVPAGSPVIGLYLGTQEINNGGTIKVRESVWLESGVTSVSTDKDSITDEVAVNALNLTAAQVRTAVTEVTANHSLKSQSTNDFEGLNSFRYVFEIRSTTTETELGDAQIGVNFSTGIQTDGSSDFIIERQYSISSANVASSIKKLIPPEINDPVFDGTGGTQKAHIVDQEVKPNGKDGAVLTRTFAMLPTHLDEWDEMVIRFPGVDRGPFQLDEGFAFRSQPYSEAVPVRICRDFFLSNPQRICRPAEFRPVDENGNRVTVLTANTVPTADEYIGYVNSGKYLNDRVSIHRWQGDIWERRITQFKAE